MLTQADLEVRTLGDRTIASPLALSTRPQDDIADYVPDDARVALTIESRMSLGHGTHAPLWLEKAGPREQVFFDPKKTRAAIVTCGGLCPGINNVIRSIVLELHHKYGVHEILGVRFGFEGLSGDPAIPPLRLGPDEVRSVHKHGGSFLGLSRGKQEPRRMVAELSRLGVNLLFAIGGDGTLRGAHAIAEEAAAMGAALAVIGVPKTVDNDVALVDKTFGFESAVDVARLTVDAAHTEALSARNGVAIVKLMGRDAGFIAAHATLASAEVNFCLIPEARFELEGPRGLLAALETRLRARGHAVVVVAEGCAAHLGRAGEGERDASGNLRYASGAADVGPVLRDRVTAHFAACGLKATVKYIDPSYIVRSVPANAYDSVFCDTLARDAVHAGMAGKTDIVLGRTHGVFTHVPLRVVTSQRKRIDTDGSLWLAVCETTGQPVLHA